MPKNLQPHNIANNKLTMSTILNSIQANNYPIYFNENGYEELNTYINNNKYSNLFVIVDTNTNEFCLSQFLPLLATNLTIEIIEFEAGEPNKNIETCVQIWNVLTELGADRKS